MKNLDLNAENLLSLEQFYCKCCPNGKPLFHQRRKKALGEWEKLVNQQRWDEVNSFNEIYEKLKRHSRQVRGVGRERILSTAAEIAYRHGLEANATYEEMKKHRLYIRQITNTQKLTLQGWQLVGFLCYYQNRLTQMQRNIIK